MVCNHGMDPIACDRACGIKGLRGTLAMVTRVAGVVHGLVTRVRVGDDSGKHELSKVVTRGIYELVYIRTSKLWGGISPSFSIKFD